MQPEQSAQLLQAVLAIGLLVVVGWVIYQNRHLWKRERRNDLYRTQPNPKRPPETHGIKIGMNIQIGNVGAAHGTIVLVGWDARWPRWFVGDYFTIFAGGNFSTRYKIERIDGRAGDSFFWAECSFAPRGA